ADVSPQPAGAGFTTFPGIKKALGLPLLEQVTSWWTHRQPNHCGIPHLIYATAIRRPIYAYTES
ncbi:hypothetical protein, partial [Escherichia sp. TW14182]|uniref:hypothetical protein n=1 Tax=Escherichia sp. TW14182 TaxID=754336 RepID=UPI001ED9354C